MTAPRHRSLNLAQTLDELLGMGKSGTDSERTSLNSPARPPTRHGRDSASAGSSNEENKEPTPKSPSIPGTSIQSLRIHDKPPKIETEDDDFLAKLNALRRRSLVASGDAADRKIPNGEERKKEIVRKQDGIKEESDEEKPESRRPSTSSSHKTFQIGESSSATVVFKDKGQEKPHLPKPAPRTVGKPSTSNEHRFISTDDSNHSKWIRRKAEEEREKKKLETEKEEEKKRNEEEKKKNAQRTFEKWKETYDGKLKEKKKEVKQERAKSASKEEAEKRKKEEAKKTFEAWRKEYERRVNNEKRRKEKELDEEKKRLEELAKTKKEEAEKAFLAWKTKKDKDEAEMKSLVLAKKKAAEERKKLEDDYKEMVASQAFETWLELKEVQLQQEQLLLDMPVLAPPTIPWVPPSNTVPRQFTPNKNRRRKSLDRRPRITSAGTITRSTSAKSFRPRNGNV